VQQSNISSSVIVYINALASFPSPLIILPGVTVSLFGTICGVDTIQVYGTLSLSDTGTTCDTNLRGKFKFSNIIVYDGGLLTTVAPTNLLYTVVCTTADAIFNNTQISSFTTAREFSGMHLSPFFFFYATKKNNCRCRSYMCCSLSLAQRPFNSQQRLRLPRLPLLQPYPQLQLHPHNFDRILFYNFQSH
jgi:hypothetical protein